MNHDTKSTTSGPGAIGTPPIRWVDESFLMVAAIAYRSWNCPACNGRIVVYRYQRRVNSFACFSCGRTVSREEMRQIDAAEMAGQVWPVTRDDRAERD